MSKKQRQLMVGWWLFNGKASCQGVLSTRNMVIELIDCGCLMVASWFLGLYTTVAFIHWGPPSVLGTLLKHPEVVGSGEELLVGPEKIHVIPLLKILHEIDFEVAIPYLFHVFFPIYFSRHCFIDNFHDIWYLLFFRDTSYYMIYDLWSHSSSGSSFNMFS